MKKEILLLISALFIFQGCTDSAPSCSSSDVEDLVLEISIEEIQKGLFHQFGGSASAFYQSVKNENYNKADEEMKPMLLELRKQYDSITNLSLDSIRTSEVDDELLKSTCEGNLNLNGKSFDITYDAQTTDEGDLYVNVYDL